MGFVTCLDADYFCHHSSIAGEGRKSLRDGEEVEFEVEVNASNGKLHAVNITGPGGSPLQGPDQRPTSKGGKGKINDRQAFSSGSRGKGTSGNVARPNCVFVAGLSYDTSTDSLKEHFEQAGEVIDAFVVMDRDTGNSRGFGKIVYATPEGHQHAIELLDGSELDGRLINVKDNDPHAPRGGKNSVGKGNGKGRTSGEPRPNSVFVAGLAYATTSQSLLEHFSAVGKVMDAYVVNDRETGKSRGFGKVTFDSADGHNRALEELNNTQIDGRTISVREDNGPKASVGKSIEKDSFEDEGSPTFSGLVADSTISSKEQLSTGQAASAEKIIDKIVDTSSGPSNYSRWASKDWSSGGWGGSSETWNSDGWAGAWASYPKSGTGDDAAITAGDGN
jgi:RNA recognition motif-containing protein/cold shock CspA family protein